MEMLLLNSEFNTIAVIDSFQSAIWTDRYYEPGDFEIYTAMQTEFLEQFKIGYYLINGDSEHAMIIESIQITSDIEDGNHLKITGRSLESILDRRIVWPQKTISGNFQNGIESLLNDSIINPTNADRKIENFIFEQSEDDAITSLTLKAQYTGDTLLDVIEDACSDKGIGFKVTLDDENRFVFKLYAGKDRSYDQTELPYVIFSPKFENIVNSNYIESKSAYKNVTVVAGEGEGAARRYTTVGSGSGINRRELFTDARDISSTIDEGGTLTEVEYMAQLRQRGKEKLAENNTTTSFEGETETTIMFKYGEDFFNGDIVQIADDYGHETKARITEVVSSEDESGESVYPTFQIEESEEEGDES